MKDKEQDFLNRMLERVNHKPCVNITGFDDSEPLDANQWYYYLTKWAKKGWFEYGVSARTGWFTPEFIEQYKSKQEEEE